MEDALLSDLLKATAGTAGGGVLSLGLLVWAVRRWMGQVDARLKDLTDAVAGLKTGSAVTQERHSNFVASMESLKASVDLASKSVCGLSASIQKVWLVLKTQGIVREENGAGHDISD